MTKSPKTTAAAVIAIITAILGVVSTILTGGFGAVEWGTIVPLIFTSIVGLFAKDEDKPALPDLK